MTLLQDPDLKIFWIAAAMVVALFVLELAFMLIGISGSLGETDADIGAYIDDVDIGETDSSSVDGASAASGILGTVLDIIGFRKIPMTMWLTVACASFASLGLALQLGMKAIFGFTLPAEIASGIVFAPASGVTGQIARFIAWVIPSYETSAVSKSSLARRRGTVMIGTARRGHPAEVRVYDRYENAHYLMLEPLNDEDEITQGTEVVVVRLPGGTMRALALSAG